ncbi:hypothetical protein ACQUW5_05675 [Legionella sp. CNM-1927-20]|uniref:hypothetical protein n=1 Tax=Legionella sp. CNM-1927-20 TaxID=3422221 RepID=UPI00403AE160
MKTIMALLLFGLSSCVSALSNNSLLFLTSSDADIAPLHKNHYMLNLKKPANYIIYFTPSRKSTGLIALENFISLWRNQTLRNNFSDNPPQAVLMMVTANGQQSVRAIIANPSLVKETLSYQISVLNGQPLKIEKLKFITLIFDKVSDTIDFSNLKPANYIKPNSKDEDSSMLNEP